MSKEKNVQFKIDHKFDPDTCRHHMNGFTTVLHCHHYATLYTQLADDAKDFNGKELFIQAAEDTFYQVLKQYFQKHKINTIPEKVAIARDYWKVVGMGLIDFRALGPYAATAEMEYSHVDEGWLKKWGPRDEPVNFFTCGYVAAVTALANDLPLGSYRVQEIKGLVRGDDKSVFKAVRRQ